MNKQNATVAIENAQERKPDKPDKTVEIIVNGEQKEIDHKKKELTFEEIIVLAFGEYQDKEDIVYTVTYVRGNGNGEGTLVKGESVKVKKGMIINVTIDNRS